MKKSNVVTISSFKAHQERQQAEQEWNGYLDVLSFSELITEATVAKAELEKRPQDKALTLRSKTIIQQLIKRIKTDFPELSAQLLSKQAQTNALLANLL